MTISRLDCHRILGLPMDASPSAVAARHRALALELHPDRNQNCPDDVRRARAARLSEVNRAFDELVKHPQAHHDYVMWGPRPAKTAQVRIRAPGQGADITDTLDLRFNRWAEGSEHRAPDGSVIRIPPGAPPRTYRVAGAGQPGTGGAPPGDYLLRVQHLGMHGQVISAGHEGFRRAGEMFNLFLVSLAGLWLIALLLFLLWTLTRG